MPVAPAAGWRVTASAWDMRFSVAMRRNLSLLDQLHHRGIVIPAIPGAAGGFEQVARVPRRWRVDADIAGKLQRQADILQRVVGWERIVREMIRHEVLQPWRAQCGR